MTDWTNRIVRFAKPLDGEEAKDRMKVLEDRGDRVLIRSEVYCTNWTFRPTSVYSKKDLLIVS